MHPRLEILEPRLLLSAGWVDAQIDQPFANLSQSAHVVNLDPQDHSLSDSSLESDKSLNAVLIDTDLLDLELLAKAAATNAHIIRYDGQNESIEDVLDRVWGLVKSTGRPIDSLSIISHGTGGRFALGNEMVSSHTADLHGSQWQKLGNMMAEGANLYIFGCNVVDGSGDGQALIDKLARLTGADVFASNDITGAGGDWQLEAASTGDEAELAAGLVLPLDSEVLVHYSGQLLTWSGANIADDNTVALYHFDEGSGATLTTPKEPPPAT